MLTAYLSLGRQSGGEWFASPDVECRNHKRLAGSSTVYFEETAQIIGEL